jgi:GT2 family glycosyltransferase
VEDPALPRPAVSIIIASLNRAAELQATVTQLLAQNFTDFELWVVDQSDAPDSQVNAAYFTQHSDQRVNYLHLETRGPSNARNEGLACARGGIILFVDDDVILLSPDFIRAHVRAYDNPKIGGVTGRHIERVLTMNAKHTACHISWTGRTIFNLFGTKRVPIGSCKGSNMSVRAAAITQIGGFDRRLKFLEETDLSTRIKKAGWQLIFEPAAELFHLSAPAGGVREKNPLQAEITRFECTAYYILKHRGWPGTIPFIATFTLIAAQRTIRFRTPNTLPTLLRAIITGFGSARRGADVVISK